MRYATVLCLLLAVGCAANKDFRAPDLELDRVTPIAVIPFENGTDNPKAGMTMAELLETEIYVQGYRILIPREKVVRALAMSRDAKADPHRLASALGAKGLVMGYVSEFTYKRSLGETPAVSVTVRLLDAKTGYTLWKGTRARTGRFSWFWEDSLGRLAHEISRELAQSLVKGMAK